MVTTLVTLLVLHQMETWVTQMPVLVLQRDHLVLMPLVLAVPQTDRLVWQRLLVLQMDRLVQMLLVLQMDRLVLVLLALMPVLQMDRLGLMLVLLLEAALLVPQKGRLVLLGLLPVH